MGKNQGMDKEFQFQTEQLLRRLSSRHEGRKRVILIGNVEEEHSK